jgi:hypothetical protein
MRSALLRALSLLALASAPLTSGCNGELIPNTDVPDTAENREAIEFVEQYRHAVEARNVAAVLSLVSERFYDDNGTITTGDDRDFERLAQQLGVVAGRILDIRYEMRYRRVTHRPDRVYVDYTYTSSFKIATPGGDRWETRLRDNRIELVREPDGLRIVSGI